MEEYISREAMVKNLTSDLEHHSDEGDPRTCLVMRRFIKYVEDFPAADVQPVKRGRWLPAKGWFMSKCSECGYELGMVLAAGYICCPKCTARMDGDIE